MWMPQYFWAERDAFPLYSNTFLLTGSLLVLTIVLTEIIVNLKQREIDQKQKEYEQLAMQLSSERQLNVHLTEELSRTRENLASLTALKAQYSQELDAIREEKRCLAEALEDISCDNMRLLERYEQTKQREYQLNSQIEQLRQEIEEKEQKTRNIEEKQEQIQETENTYLQQMRDVVHTHSSAVDE
jgi:chromosome segregation ATPase